MLRNIPKNLSPQLMEILLRMGHGDEIVFGDANFPADSIGKRVVHADGDTVTGLLQSLMPFFPLDHFVESNVFLMSVVPGKGEEPKVWETYKKVIEASDQEKAFSKFDFLTRQEFYDRAEKAFAVVATGEKEKYANIILKLGVVEQKG